MNWFDRTHTFGHVPALLPYFLERLEGTILRIDSKVKGVSDVVLSTRPDGKWSIKQNIGHLAEVDTISIRRLDEMKAGVAVMSPAVFEPQDYNPWSIEKVLELFRKNRQASLEKYKALDASLLVRSSLHPRLKVKMTPADLAWFDAEHDDHHLVRINEIIHLLTSRS